ncbi:hypothetical protein [Sphingobium boeckii]|uniref:Uncharacterized protein n=1 Tax=Sphingobium boeckii TaxID=1082345 RepID=A0A7W9AJQ5_9SPHN|nr:hypothetical protein [Sphingobium boeckii]MBB5686963.1 hypothetical protein [Sphingobium boeckii]
MNIIVVIASAAKQSIVGHLAGLLRCARNDDQGKVPAPVPHRRFLSLSYSGMICFTPRGFLTSLNKAMPGISGLGCLGKSWIQV